ncbi:MAG: cupin domain-containing protein [Phycisphaerae bacterium]|nr:cupin domain-containing protein [Phycisphaerae bacterium]
MDAVNAIAKVRFASAKPQTVHLHKGHRFAADLLCMEPGQRVEVAPSERIYYVVTGAATLHSGGAEKALPAGELAATAPDEAHGITNTGSQRLVCVVIRGPS